MRPISEYLLLARDDESLDDVRRRLDAEDMSGPPYQRPTCTLPMPLRLALLGDGQSPCAGCHEDRKVCGGEPRVETRPGGTL